MITRVHAYTDSKGKPHATLEHAQRAELEITLTEDGNILKGSDGAAITIEGAIDLLMSHKDEIVDILTTKPNSLVKARRLHGGTKTRAKKSTRHEAEQFPLPMEDTTQPAA